MFYALKYFKKCLAISVPTTAGKNPDKMPTKNFGKNPTEALAKLKKKLPAKLREEVPKERPTELQGNLMNNSRLFL